MHTFKQYITIFKKLWRGPLSAERAEFEITPYRDWLVLVVIMFLVGVMLIAVSVFLFALVNESEIVTIEETETKLFESVDEKKLDEVLQIFKERQSTLDALLETPPRVIDPSL